MGKQELVQNISRGDEATLHDIYAKYRQEFVYWLHGKYELTLNDATEIYQQSIILLYENAVSGKLKTLTGSLKTYLFAIGKNKVREQLRQNAKTTAFDAYRHDQAEESQKPEKMEQEHQLNNVESSFDQLGRPCRKLLRLFYYDNLSMDAIMDKLGYKNRDTAKNQKYKCMQQLRKIHLQKTSG